MNARFCRSSNAFGLLAGMLLSLWAWSLPAAVTVTILNTGDVHETSAHLPRLAAYVKARQAADPNTLFVDCGDFLNKGDPAFMVSRGEAVLSTLAACGYDACILGNHDLTYGTAYSQALFDRYRLPLTDANSVWPEGMRPASAPPYRLFRLTGVTVAVIGTASEHINHASDRLVRRLPVPQVLQELIPEVRRQADVVILLTHVGTRRDEAIAAELHRLFPDTPSVDAIIGAHDHLAYDEGRVHAPSGILIHHAGDCGRFLGETVLTWDGERVTARRAGLIPMTPDLPEDHATRQIRDSHLEHLPADVPLLELAGGTDMGLPRQWLAQAATRWLAVDAVLFPPDVLVRSLPSGAVLPGALFGCLRRLEPIVFEMEGGTASLDAWLAAAFLPAERPLAHPVPEAPREGRLRVAWFAVAFDAALPPTASLGLPAALVSPPRRRGGECLWRLAHRAVRWSDSSRFAPLRLGFPTPSSPLPAPAGPVGD